ncbi:Alkaline phosphatase-like, alpha/beta/alpha [Cordyceps fumosorosea ARSEF 2679]|uniref:Alkaline phosphatase n=1 Tax=Cordyceps fumosorosea (strain ARSEF 2679) TaxID=1081104 RepID=A0A168CPW2_CORFA|nr:Alkaline phosphatase-like, alpha/beta/alpha [Cordyceps fumosorosea ARSEF 2679]OAA71646.1 Alkaline phosphatase-like, alpha/beta/alpha [Cordyceps fumosorosea ARSEF 2679]
MLYRLSSVIVAGALVLLGSVNGASCVPRARSFIYVVPDGYGPVSQTMARDYESIMTGKSTPERPNSAQIGVDEMLIGTVRTQASDNLVTDSAASATAFACGIKTYNGAIGVDDDGKPVASVLEAAHLSGFKTGLIATSRITHATPACYCSHVLSRDSENEIAAQQIGQTHPFGAYLDLILGGGRRQYLPRSAGGQRTDGVDLVAWAKEKGYQYAADRAALDAATVTGGRVPLPFLGLFASSHMAYELDRDGAKEPSLLDMTKLALASLEEASKGSQQGYFIMIEASRIDHAGHSNDGPGHVHDILMYNQVMTHLKEHVAAHPDTQLLSAADHECGGLTLPGRWDPRPLAAATRTSEHLVNLLAAYKGGDQRGYFKTELLPQYGLADATDAATDALLATYKARGSTALVVAMGQELARRAGIDWSTTGHTSVDVNLYGAAKAQAGMAAAIGGNRDNTELPRYVERALGVNMANATARLRAHGEGAWVQRRDELPAIKRAANLAAWNHMH